jgi:hypothetical protein
MAEYITNAITSNTFAKCINLPKCEHRKTRTKQGYAPACGCIFLAVATNDCHRECHCLASEHKSNNSYVAQQYYLELEAQLESLKRLRERTTDKGYSEHCFTLIGNLEQELTKLRGEKRKPPYSMPCPVCSVKGTMFDEGFTCLNKECILNKCP